MRFLVSCAPGLESLLEEEIKALGMTQAGERGIGVLAYDLEWPQAFEIMLCSRIASRVLLSLRRFSAKNEAMLYDQVRRVDWKPFLETGRTMAVHTHGRSDAFALTFAALKIKDAVCDEYRKNATDRPSVDRADPDLRLEAFFDGGGRCELSLDLCGTPLHRRGYRDESGDAPLRENRAAALLRFAGFDGRIGAGGTRLIDPFCGSGTIVIEAALMAQGRVPGVLRPAHEFKLTKIFRAQSDAFALRWRDLGLARRPSDQERRAILAVDRDKGLLRQARDNARRAGVEDFIEFAQGDARNIDEKNALIVSNPPYGVRLEDEHAAAELLNAFTRQIKHHCAPATLALVLPEGPMAKSVGFKPDAKLKVKSGSLDLVFQKFSIRAGKFVRGESGADGAA